MLREVKGRLIADARRAWRERNQARVPASSSITKATRSSLRR